MYYCMQLVFKCLSILRLYNKLHRCAVVYNRKQVTELTLVPGISILLAHNCWQHLELYVVQACTLNI